jgi:DNA modification methylase
MITIQQIDFREIDLPKDKRILSITDPPYNIRFKYGVCKDNLSEQEYIEMLSKIPKPCVIINYPEETLNYVIPAMRCNPDKVLFWCYNSHLPRAVRMISFFGIKPDLSKYKIPYRNPTDKRVKKLIENGSQGTSLKEWFVIEQVKNVSKEYQGYANQIPEELIRIILSLSEGQFDTVFDPFCGSGTTLAVGIEKGYDVIGTDIDSNAISISKKRLEVRAEGTTTDGIPSKTKVLGILPNEL